MPLPKSLEKAFKAHLTARRISLACPECKDVGPGTVEWVAMPTLDKKGRAERETSVPAVALICAECGHVRLFSPVKAGIFLALHQSQ